MLQPRLLVGFLSTWALALLLASAPASAGTIDLATGTTGSLVMGQGFNETRAAVVTVLSASAVQVTSMTLTGLTIDGATSATVGARIYAVSGATLIASSSVVITSAASPVTLPITATLAPGATYRVGFYVETSPPWHGSGALFDPTPVGTYGAPYVVSGGQLRVDGGCQSGADAYPGNANILIPYISLETAPPTASACEQPRVAIEALDTATSSWQFVGNGVLIGDPDSTTSSQWVLTAAHIPSALAGKPMRVIAGICDRTDLAGSQTAAVQTSYYDLFVPPYVNDIALLELDTALVYGANVQPATLPGASSGNFAGAVGSFLGWWTAPCGGVLPTLCQSMDMTVLTNAATQAYLSSISVNDSMMGVLDFASVNVPGNGSPGSGFFIQDAGSCKLAGILSWGVNDGGGCHLATFPSICTRVSYFLEWIANTTAGTSMGTTSYTPCGCAAMTLASYGGLPKIGNVNFGLQIEDAPVPGTAMLFVQAGAPLSLPGSTFPLGTWVLPSAGISIQFGPRSTTGGLPCGGTVQFPLPLPMSIPPGAVGVVVSAQAIVQCPAGLGLTNGWQFTLKPN